MIQIDSRLKKPDTLLRKHLGALLIDDTSHATDEWQQLSPLYPHYGIPVPFSPEVTAACVEGVWLGLKVCEHEDIDLSCFTNDTMHNLKRTVTTYGSYLDHCRWVYVTQLLDYTPPTKKNRYTYLPTAGCFSTKPPS